ncbi:hypothetical protein [Ketobacter sp.]|uniref:hypothetical protein n=1 Tax=Ketobacter sp. TaxID=2083498 RepID=UPI000F2B4172|nr:hypothetical protein [Ketobacter sp.]RLU00381.1 MAG: hypothetical protein D9N14_07795 [Ketobacter sp.]
MLESERLAYLHALGITQYGCQQPLVGATALPELSAEQIWGVSATEAVDAVADRVSTPGTQVQPAQLQSPAPSQPAPPPVTGPTVASAANTDAAAEVPQLDVSKLQLEQERAPKPVPKPQAKAQRFALAVITLPQRFRLFVELAQADAPGLSAVEHRMVADLLGVLDCPGALDQFGAKLYRWPLVDNPRIAADQQAAREGLLGFVASAPVVSKSVFLGLRAPSLLVDAQPGARFALTAEGNDDTLITYSLREMQSDWRLKAEAWRQIFPFLADLRNPQP